MLSTDRQTDKQSNATKGAFIIYGRGVVNQSGGGAKISRPIVVGGVTFF